jgi:hypothetical protein
VELAVAGVGSFEEEGGRLTWAAAEGVCHRRTVWGLGKGGK